MEKYTINQKIEESACVACGEPLYIGDTAYQSDSGDITCSRTCCAAVEAIDSGLTCPACDGAPVHIGGLGTRSYFRCQNCGMTFSPHL